MSMLAISPEIKARAKQDWRNDSHSRFEDWWFQNIEKACNEDKVSNDIELLLCLKKLHAAEVKGGRRDAGNFQSFLKMLISYFYPK